VKDKPYVSVLDFLIKHYSKKRITRDIIGCDFKMVEGQPKYMFSQNFLHPDLETK
jgi:hypothetical protein